MNKEVEQQILKEREKLEKAKKVFERQNKVLKNLPNRKERQEIDSLKEQLKELQDDIRRREQRNKLNIDRVKKQVQESIRKKQELEDEKNALFHLISELKGEPLDIPSEEI